MLLAALLPLAAAVDVCPDPERGPTSGYRSWACVERAKVLDALDGRPDQAIHTYGQLVHNELPAGDPALAEALFWLAQVSWVKGDVEGARVALDRCVRMGVDTTRCTDLRTRIDLEHDAIRSVPVSWTFDTSDHGLFHPRAFWDKGGLKLVSVGQRAWLAWQTTVDPLKGDQLVVGFHEPKPSPRRIAIELRSLEIPALLEVEFVDTLGHHYSAGEGQRALPAREWTTLTFDLAHALPVDPAAPSLDPSRLYRLILHDVTALSGRVGHNELQIDTFVVE